MNEPVSVIITCYNLQSFIRPSIESVLAQDYDGEIQIIVVDDCSTDHSRDIISSYFGLECIFLQKNGGVMSAMLFGIAHARHDVIFFLDGDDVWRPEKISASMTHFRGGCSLVTHDLLYVDSFGEKLPIKSRVSSVLGGAASTDVDGLIRDCILRHLDYVWLGSAFSVRRSLVDLDGFVKFCKTHDRISTCYQDWPLAVWVAANKSSKFGYVDQALFEYRIHSENYSGSTQTLDKLSRNLQKSHDTMALIERILKYMDTNDVSQHTYTRARKRYALLLSMSRSSRAQVMSSFLLNGDSLKLDSDSAKIILRLLLVIVFGAGMAFSIVERFKSR